MDNSLIENNISKKICMHTYLTQCKTNTLSPGFADFLRGTITLYYLSKKYGYQLLLDNKHPIFQYFKKNKYIVENEGSNDDVIELIPDLDYSFIYNEINRIFQENKSFNIITNSFYNYNNGTILNWGKITDDCVIFLKDILQPSLELEDHIRHVFQNIYKISENEPYTVFHIRSGDKFLIYDDNNINDEIFTIWYEKINNIIQINKNEKYVLLTDCSILGNRLKNRIEGLYYWDNKKVHLGSLNKTNGSEIKDTLTDFFILSKSNKIFIPYISGFSSLSGFSTAAS